MKKTSLLIAIALILSIYTPVFAIDFSVSMDENINRALVNLDSALNNKISKIDNIQADLMAQVRANYSVATFNICEVYVARVGLVHAFLHPLLSLKQTVKEDSLKAYYQSVNEYLKISNILLESYNGAIRDYYSYLENKATMRTVDKVKEILRTSIDEIDSVSKLLSIATK